MKHPVIVLAPTVIALMVACQSGGKKETTSDKFKKVETKAETKVEAEVQVSEKGLIDFNDKGVGPIKEVTLNTEIDQAMVDKGKDVFKKKCTACHRPDEKFIGPAPKNILKRRTPEWIMNMILNPENMIKNDPIAKQLLIDHNGAPMANQNLTEGEARSVLEYFRTLND